MTRSPRAKVRLLTALSCVALVAAAMAQPSPWPLAPRRATYVNARLSAAEPAYSASPAMAHVPVHAARASVQWGLDPTFGTGGVVRLPKTGVVQAVLRPDGKLVALVQDYGILKGPPYPISNQAYLVDLTGTLEITRVLPVDVWAKGVQSDNKLIIGDARFDANLNDIDPTFSVRGEANLPAGFDGRRYFMQTDDKILIAGNTPLSYALQLRRLNSDGSIDAGFGPVTLPDINPFAVSGFDPNGRIVVGGDSVSTRFGMGHAYSITGTVLGALPSPLEQLSSPTDYFTSWYFSGPTGSFIWFAVPSSFGRVGHIYRSSSNNGLDSAFGTSGVVTVTLPVSYSWQNQGSAILVKPDNSLVLIADIAQTTDQMHFGAGKTILIGLNADGSPNAEFGPQGVLYVEPPVSVMQTQYAFGDGDWQFPQAVFLTADGKILIAGEPAIIRLAPFTVRGRVYLPALSRN